MAVGANGVNPQVPRAHHASDFPRRVIIKEVLRSRYQPGTKPTDWAKRYAAVEEVRSTDGEIIFLESGGGQGSPAPGWELLLLGPPLPDGNAAASGAEPVRWTLYGIRRPAATA